MTAISESRAIAFAEIYYLRGDSALARSSGDPDGTLDYVQNLLACTYVLAGRYDDAPGLLEPLHDKANFTISGWLCINPEWAPLHGNPRFEMLTGGRQ